MKRYMLIGLVLTGVFTTAAVAECGEGKESGEAKEIVVAVAPGFYPITYVDDDGNPAGYDVEVMKKADELLEEYNFVYEVVDKEAMNVGVQTGAYHMGINSLFKTDERLEIYLMPESNMGYTPVGFIQREDDDITDFDTAVAEGKKVYPIRAASGIRLIVDAYNKEHEDAPVEYETYSQANYETLFESIRNGQYDYAVDLIPVFDLQPENMTAGLKMSDPVAVVPTYPIINKDESDLCDAVNETLKTLQDNGTLSEISVDQFGYDLFKVEAK
ncbi:MAG: transporter substrate-binding domain-containing protein [Blautia sp.]|nr:transporter substrate-binding domain-containing protein [Blautia sp.]